VADEDVLALCGRSSPVPPEMRPEIPCRLQWLLDCGGIAPKAGRQPTIDEV
jgi:hypothetical protein